MPIEFSMEVEHFKEKDKKENVREFTSCFASHRAFGNLPDLLFFYLFKLTAATFIAIWPPRTVS